MRAFVMLHETGEVMGVLTLAVDMELIDLTPKVKARASTIHEEQVVNVRIYDGLNIITGDYELPGGNVHEFSLTETKIL